MVVAQGEWFIRFEGKNLQKDWHSFNTIWTPEKNGASNGLLHSFYINSIFNNLLNSMTQEINIYEGLLHSWGEYIGLPDYEKDIRNVQRLNYTKNFGYTFPNITLDAVAFASFAEFDRIRQEMDQISRGAFRDIDRWVEDQ